VRRATAKDANQLAHDAIALFKRVESEYADVRIARLGPDTLGEMTKYKLLWHPSTAAPDIRGIDLDGKELKLSDFRGKVVVLSFWSSGCVPCLKAVPTDNKLIDQMKGRPFAMLSVNIDTDLAAARKAAGQSGMKWRSWWDGKQSITKAWRVEGVPAIWVIDDKGVVRQANDFDRNELSAVVEKYVVEAERNSRK
jgi:peroxiredoxin